MTALKANGLAKSYKSRQVVKDLSQIGRASCRERVYVLV